MMELSTLQCETCDYRTFASLEEFYDHHLKHLHPCSVTLVRLNDKLFKKVLNSSYVVNKGVARRSGGSKLKELVSPLKIALKKQPGGTLFEVVPKQVVNSEPPSEDEDEENDDDDEDDDCTGDEDEDLETYLKAFLAEQGQKKGEVEGNKLLERLGAGISFSRKSGSKVKEEPDEEKDTKSVAKQPVAEDKGRLLERLSSIGGISIAAKPKVNNGAGVKQEEAQPAVGKIKALDISQLRKIKQDTETVDKKPLDKNSLLEKLSGLGGISFAAKGSAVKPKVEEKEEPKKPEPSDEESTEGEDDDDDDIAEEFAKVTQSSVDLKPVLKKSPDEEFDEVEEKIPIAVLANETNTLETSGSPAPETKKFIRVKNSTVLRKEKEEIAEAAESSTGPEKEPVAEKDKTETGIDILERLTDSLTSVVSNSPSQASPDQAVPATQQAPRKPTMEVMAATMASSPTPSEQLHPDFIAPDCDNPAVVQQTFTAAPGPQPQNSSEAMVAPQVGGDESANQFTPAESGYPNEGFTEPEQMNNSGQVSAAFTGMMVEGQTHQGHQGENQLEQSGYWQTVAEVQPGIEQPQQDPLMTTETGTGGETMSQALRESLLQNFLNDTQTHQAMPAEGSEYMSLERLGQGLEAQQQQQQQQQQQAQFVQPMEQPGPMDQLAQQVQRLPNSTPQINVIPQHHMQAPQPQQLHAGMTIPPPHLQQQPQPQMAQQPYDQINSMQPPMPPLYQGFPAFNQFNQQTPQTPPRPPVLQQRPQIQPRSFQSLAAPRQRPRMPVKRTMMRLPSPLEMTPPKQRRPDIMQGRGGAQNTSPAKLPSGLTITPPKKTQEANKVANVLASRGITVTPAAGRQQQQQQQRSPQRPALPNLGSNVSITTSSQRMSGGFAVPGPRRNTPIVNHNVDRPERCTTVDLTLDDEPPPRRTSGPMGRYSCAQCPKVFTSSVALESHKASHRAAGALGFKCDRCTAQYPTAQGLQQHKLTFHKAKQIAPDLAIPIVDLNHPGARDQLSKCGVHSFLPLSQLQSNSNGFFGIPIINLDTAKEKAVSNLNTLGAGNIFVLGKMKSLNPR